MANLCARDGWARAHFACGTNENRLTDPSPTGGAEFFEFVDARNQIRDNEFRGIVAERTAKFLIDRYGPSGVIERTGEASFVGITDIAEAIVPPTNLSGSLNGRISTYDKRVEPTRTTSSCRSDHRFRLERITGGS